MRERHEGDRLSAFLDDELGEDEALRVTRHLARCDACLAELEEIRATRSALRGLPNLDPPEALFSDALAEARTVRLRRQRRMRVAGAAVGVGMLVGTAIYVAGGDNNGSVVPPVDMYVVDHVARVGGGPMLTPVELGTVGR